jgi:hypothetical protein
MSTVNRLMTGLFALTLVFAGFALTIGPEVQPKPQADPFAGEQEVTTLSPAMSPLAGEVRGNAIPDGKTRIVDAGRVYRDE